MSEPTPTVVVAEKRQQCGQDIWVAPCPKCGVTIALNGQGKIICSCGSFLKFTDKPE